jgi:hypothetical protein
MPSKPELHLETYQNLHQNHDLSSKLIINNSTNYNSIYNGLFTFKLARPNFTVIIHNSGTQKHHICISKDLFESCIRRGSEVKNLHKSPSSLFGNLIDYCLFRVGYKRFESIFILGRERRVAAWMTFKNFRI